MPEKWVSFLQSFVGREICQVLDMKSLVVLILCGVGEQGCCVSSGGMPNGVSRSQVK